MIVERVAPFLNITGLTQEQYDALVVVVRWGLFDVGTKWSRIVKGDLLSELERYCTA